DDCSAAPFARPSRRKRRSKAAVVARHRCPAAHSEHYKEIAMPTIKAIEARLRVTDVKRSAAFYADVLDFEIGTLWPDDEPHFAILHRDGMRLQLGKRNPPAADARSESCTIWLDASD